MIVRHKNVLEIETIARYAHVPVINAMTDINHPCEILPDLYAISNKRSDYKNVSYLFCGGKGNIGRTWKEASLLFGCTLEQCCCKGYKIDDLTVFNDINRAIIGKDIICPDSLPAGCFDVFRNCQITKAIMDQANPDAILNPCPPFYRGEKVSAGVIASDYFVGYEFKNHG